MTQSEIEMEKIKSQDKIAKRHEDREDKRNKRSSYTRLGGDLSKVAGGVISGLINSPDWYKQYAGLDGINTTIPDFTVGDQPDQNLRDGIGVVDGNTSVFRCLYLQTIGQARVLESTAINQDVSYRGKGEINSAISRIRANLGKRNSLAFTLSKDTFGRYMIAVIDGLFVPMKRLKTALDWYTAANAFYPLLSAKVITALGFNYDDFDAHIANYRDQYCKWANKINESIPMVKSNTFLERRVFLCGLGLKDRDDARAQHVIFCPENEAYMSSNDDIVRYYSVNNQGYDEFLTIIESNFAILTDGATWKQVIRLFLNGFDEKEFYKLPTDPDAISSFVGYSEEMLNQLHNLTTMPCSSPISQYGYDASSLYVGRWIGSSLSIGGNAQEDVIQGIAAEVSTWGATTGVQSIVPKYGPAFLRWGNALTTLQIFTNLFPRLIVNASGSQLLFNTFKRASADDFLVGTRLSTLYGSAAADQAAISTDMNLAGFHGTTGTTMHFMAVYPLCYGTEMVDTIIPIRSAQVHTTVRSVTLFDTWNGDDYTPAEPQFYYNFIYGGPSYSGMAQVVESYSLASAIDWLPLTKVYINGNTFTTIGELSHYTTIPLPALSKLHGQAILSEFSIAQNKFLPPLK